MVYLQPFLLTYVSSTKFNPITTFLISGFELLQSNLIILLDALVYWLHNSSGIVFDFVSLSDTFGICLVLTGLVFAII